MAFEVVGARIRWGVALAIALGIALGVMLSERIEERRGMRIEKGATSVAPEPPVGVDWYVSPSGSDDTGCGGQGSPCRTVNYVLINKVSAGDTVGLQPGIYPGGTDIQLNDPVNHDNITITAVNQQNKPELRAQRIVISDGVNGVVLSYLNVNINSRSDWYGGAIETYEYPLTVDNCEIHDGALGILVRVPQQVTITNNEIYDTGLIGTTFDTHCVGIANHQRDPLAPSWNEAILVEGNLLHDCEGDGLMELSDEAVGLDFNFLIVRNNIIYNNQEQGIDLKGTDYVRIHDNEFYGNGFGGIAAQNSSPGHDYWWVYNNVFRDHANYALQALDGSQSNNWLIYNNLFYRNVSNPTYNGCAVHLPGDLASTFYHNTLYMNTDVSQSNCVVADCRTCGVQDNGGGDYVINNVFYNNGTGPNDRGNISTSGSSGTPDYNYVYPTTCGTGSCKTGTNAITFCYAAGNCPAFVDIGADNFRLQMISSVVDAGTALSSPYDIDLDGITRPQLSGWDPGAYEYH